MKIRLAGMDDVPAIARVTVDTWKTAYRGLLDQKYLDNLSYEKREEGWRNFPFDTAFIYVAEDGAGNIIAFAAAGPERTDHPVFHGELYAIYIRDDYQRQGIGDALFQAVKQHLLDSGIDSLMLWVLSDNHYRRFYDKQGGIALESRQLQMDDLTCQVTAYGWLDI
ncbi:MAG: N-acetyltransferase family protein [Deltaproteobacteria bacterium]